MWQTLQAAIYASLALGCAILLFVLIRQQPGQGRTYHLLEIGSRLAALWTLSLGVLAILTAGVWWAYVWRRTAQIGLVVLALVTAEFATAFVDRPRRRWSWLYAAAALPILAVLVLDGLPAWASFPALGLEAGAAATLLLAAAWLILSGATWWIAVQALHLAVGAQHRNRIRYLLTTLVSFAVGDVLILLGGIPDIYLGLAARLVGLAIVTVALLRHNLPDVRRLLLMSVAFLLRCTAVGVLLAASITAAAYFSGTWPVLLRHIDVLAEAVVAGALASVSLVPPLRRLLDRLLLGKQDNLQTALRDFGQQISIILDLRRLAGTTLDWLETYFQVQRSAFLLLTPQGENRVELRAAAVRDTPAPSPRTFAADSRFLAHFYKTGRPLSQYDLDLLTWFHDLADDERQWLKDLRVDLYVPVLVGGRPAALLAVGPRGPGRAYTPDDRDTLLILAAQAGTALDNARLVDDLRRVQDDLHRLSTQLAETNAQLRRLDQVKTDFVSIAAHELRTPLSQIYGYSDVLSTLNTEDQNDVQMMHEFVDGISRGAMRLKRVIDAMLDVSLIETGSLALRPVKLPIPVVMKNAVETVRPAADGRQLTIRVGDLSHLPYVEADGVRLEQALVSVLSNAVKFTPDGGEIRISGRTLGHAPGEQSVELAVADTGIGINPEQKVLIFDKFYRGENLLLHSTDETRFKGAGPGLGLAIAKGIIEAHGGRIWVESPGRDEQRCPGSTFYLRLPVTAARSDGEAGTTRG